MGKTSAGPSEAERRTVDFMGRIPSCRKVLIADDDGTFRALLDAWFKDTGYHLFFASNGAEVAPLAKQCRPGCIILDFELGDQTALEVCQTLRSEATLEPIPIIILTSHAEEKLRAYRNCGANHFVIKNDSDLKELQAILDATFRRADKDRRIPEKGAIATRGRIRIDTMQKKVWAAGQRRYLQPKCFDLLCALLRHPDGASKEDLLAEGWGDGQDPNTLAKTIQRLREDLALKGDDPVISFRGGYQLVG